MATITTELIEAKRDERGRKIMPRGEREALVRAYESSRLTQKAFAQRERTNSTIVGFVGAILPAARRDAECSLLRTDDARPLHIGAGGAVAGRDDDPGRQRRGARTARATHPMLTFPTALRIFLAVEPVDMRKSFNGLWSLTEQKLVNAD
eukprot:TRINITY_DN63_c0_g2_i4.p1 TRINITY_DN63_c0_g2~~TRINITY_DN63_c0_g2_i4.p1  ORF type:complete len:150 (-),score=8.68 TRINITY_DN63_c0_g2_i4:71-520(-)